MDQMTRVLVVHDLRSYRDGIAAALRTLRPGVEVFEAEPRDLDREILRLHPLLVICSQVTDLARYCAPNWIELYPDHETRVVVSIGGKQSTFSDLRFPELISIVDGIADGAGA